MSKKESKETIKKPVIILGLAFIALGCTLGIASFSWFASPKTSSSVDGMVGEATGSYFEEGDGTAEHPYGIINAQQLYYFTWLQDMGYFNKEVEAEDGTKSISTTYFKLMGDIDASGKILPPCGTETYPFLGNFDANGYTISNLTISNTIESGYITSYPTRLDSVGSLTSSSTSETGVEQFNSQKAIVGFFGIIGQYNSVPSAAYDSSVNQVTNLYLDNLTIKTKKSNLLVGIFAGYANGQIENCGVHYATMNINGASSTLDSFTKLSEYTLVGSYNKDKFSWDSSGTGSGSDTGYGTSANIKSLHLSLINNGLKDSTGEIGQIPSKTVLPFRYTNTTLIKGTGSSKSIDAVKNYGSKTINVNPSEYSTYQASTKGNNLGYYSGVVETLEQSLDYNVDDFGIQSGTAWNPTNANLTTPPDSVLTYLKSNGTHLMRFTSGNNSQYVRDLDYAFVENACVGTWTGDLIIPANGVWVAPKENGKFRFVFYNPGYSSGTTAGVYYVLLKRTTAGDYSSAFDGYNSMGTTLTYYCKYGYFETSASTQYEYFIGYNTYGANSPWIAYMDIGTDAGDGEEPSTERSFDTTFDFVTKENGVLTKITDTGYTKSNVFFEVDATTGDKVFAWRRATANDTITVLYYESSTTALVTAQGTGSNSKAKDANCEEAEV